MDFKTLLQQWEDTRGAVLCTYRLAVQAGRAHRVCHVAHGRHGAAIQVSGALQKATACKDTGSYVEPEGKFSLHLCQRLPIRIHGMLRSG